MTFEGIEMFLQKGDVITSKKGILMHSSLTERAQLVWKAEYLGNGTWRVKEDKAHPREFIDVEKVNQP